MLEAFLHDPISVQEYKSSPLDPDTVFVRDILANLTPRLTESRQRRIDSVIKNRTQSVIPVLENIYDRGNISAVLRTAEAMGVLNAHVIELSERFKEANRVTAGADKWLHIERWKSTVDCVRELKKRGVQILATHLDEKAKNLDACDLVRPTAIVFGNEKDGISKEMIELCDQTVILPMVGFVQSYNISVAAAISLEKIFRARSVAGHKSDLTDSQREALKAHYTLRTLDNPLAILRALS